LTPCPLRGSPPNLLLMFLIFDTETTGLPRDWKAPITDTTNWPRMVQLAWQLHGPGGALLSSGNLIVRPDGYEIPFNASKVHGITTEKALKEGLPLVDVVARFLTDLEQTQWVAGHNIEFDLNVLGCELERIGIDHRLLTEKNALDTMKSTIDFCALPGGKGGKFKFPTLTELHEKLFGESFDAAHDAAYDVHATTKCFFALLDKKVLSPTGFDPQGKINYEAPLLGRDNFSTETSPSEPTEVSTTGADSAEMLNELAAAEFVHLHCHSRFSVLQSTSKPEDLINKAKAAGMKAVAMTDYGNLMGAFIFTRAAKKAGVKAIVGCEMNICRDMHNKTEKDDGFQVVLLAKNRNGYRNLMKLSSKANTEGFYYVPRIDRDLLLAYKEDLIVLTGSLWGEVPYLILNEGEGPARKALEWWKEHFGENLYVELMRHGVEEEEVVNTALLKMAR
jgi:DNA polymerase III subunit alpha